MNRAIVILCFGLVVTSGCALGYMGTVIEVTEGTPEKGAFRWTLVLGVKNYAIQWKEGVEPSTSLGMHPHHISSNGRRTGGTIVHGKVENLPFLILALRKYKEWSETTERNQMEPVVKKIPGAEMYRFEWDGTEGKLHRDTPGSAILESIATADVMLKLLERLPEAQQERDEKVERARKDAALLR